MKRLLRSSRTRAVASGVLLILIASRLLAVNIIPVITNDSVGYLTHAQDALGDGLVWQGYRQLGYPVVLAITKALSQVVGIEPVLWVAVFQRLILVTAIGYAVWLFRLWSVPLVLIATAPDVVAYSNLLLTEGLTVPLALLYSTLISHAVMVRYPDKLPAKASQRMKRVKERTLIDVRSYLVLAATAVVLVMTLVKYQSIALTFPLFALFWLDIRERDRRRFGLLTGLAVVGLLTITSGVMALENRSEHDDLFPISRGIRNGYWGTYQLVFNLNPENRSIPELSEYYADGEPFAFIRETERTLESYPAQRAAFEDAISFMLEEAGLDRSQQQMAAMWGAARGGRFDDIGGIIKQITTSSSESVEATIHRNVLARQRGIDVYVASYNDGRRIEPVLTAAAFDSVLGWHARSFIKFAGPTIIFVVTAALITTSGLRVFLISALAGAIGVFALVGLLITDNYRYVITAHMYLLPIGTLAALLLFQSAITSPVWERMRRLRGQVLR